MKFVRKGFPHEEDENQYLIDNMGSLFIELAVQYYNEGLSIINIAKKLKSNKTTVGKYLKPFQKNLQKGDVIEGIEAVKVVLQLGYREVAAACDSRGITYKKNILQIIKSLRGNATTTRVKQIGYREYSWIYTHDRAWLEENLPPKRESASKLDLVKVDDDVCSLIEQASKDIWCEPPSYQITRNRILDKLSPKFRNLVKNNSKCLHKTNQLLEKNAENKNDFLIRRFPYVIRWYKESNHKNCSMNLIINRFYAYKNCSDEVKQMLEEHIFKMNTEIKK